MTTRRRGFVLLTVLVVLALTALVLAGIARHSLRLVLDAQAGRRRLQARWAVTSLREGVLPRASELLDRAADGIDSAGEGNERPPARLAGSVELDGVRYDLLLADDQAKINLNVLLRERDRDAVGRLVRARRTGRAPPVRLRPLEAPRQATGLPAFGSWGQVFALERVPAAEAAERLAASTGELTCWGTGRLNLRRASDEAVECVAGLAVNRRTAARLNELRRKFPEESPASLVNRLALRRERREQLLDLLADRSGCYSLWIRGGGGSQFAVVESGPGGGATLSTFRW